MMELKMEWNGERTKLQLTRVTGAAQSRILDKEECWQHWACSYSLCGEIRAIIYVVASSTLTNSASYTS